MICADVRKGKIHDQWSFQIYVKEMADILSA